MRWSLCLFFVSILAGCGSPSFLITPVQGAFELRQTTVKPATKSFAGKIAIIPVEGTLSDVLTGGLLQSPENRLSLFIQELDQAADDDTIKAVVLRVNSPGGTVTTSDTMYDAVLRFKAKTHKPVIAAAQEVDASGAYYVSCAADKIVANPTSVVGSIGVIFESFEFVGTMDKLGIDSIVVKSAELKDMGSPYKHITDKERLLMQDMVNEYFARFKSVVTSNRHLTDPDTIAHVTTGQVFSGETAAKLGLVDQVGRLDDAIDLAEQLSNTPGAEIVMYMRPYAFKGSIYAQADVPQPKANEMTLKLPMMQDVVPSGFYYLWQP
jgi:protease-4